MITNAEDFRLNFYSISRMANESNEVMIIKGDIAIIRPDMIKKTNDNISIKDYNDL